MCSFTVEVGRRSFGCDKYLPRSAFEEALVVIIIIIIITIMWSGERPVDDDVQCFPGGHRYPPGVLFGVRGHRNACNLYRFG